MENLIKSLQEKVESAEKSIEQAKRWIKEIEAGNTFHGSKEHYERSVIMNEAYMVGLKTAIREAKAIA